MTAAPLQSRVPRSMRLVLGAAALFGASTPIAKTLLRDIDPVPFAGLLYLGSGIGAGAWLGVRALIRRQAENDSKGRTWPDPRAERLRGADLPWLAAATLCGGVAAPIALLLGLRSTPAGATSLLLSFETAATTLIAAAAFRERIGGLVWAAVASITLGSMMLALRHGAAWELSGGALAVMGACTLWALDTNLTRRIASRDPFVLVTVKGLVGGAATLALSALAGQVLPAPGAAGAALALGFVSYGVSMILFIAALRDLRAARSAALFGTAPFVGAVLSAVLFREPIGVFFLGAALLMGAGVALLVAEASAHHDPAIEKGTRQRAAAAAFDPAGPAGIGREGSDDPAALRASADRHPPPPEGAEAPRGPGAPPRRGGR